MINKQRGVGLLEVLIAVLVLAVGLLGFAAMQTQALRANFETMQRAKASMYANDMFDRMRSNISKATSSDAYLRDFYGDLPAVKKDCQTTSCDTDELAAWDLNDWVNYVSTSTNNIAKVAIIRPENGQPRYFKISIRLVESQSLQANNTVELDETDVTVEYDFYAIL